ncbi:MAG: FAD:protein FMN transferase, partial [Oscillospiraceae bacterium]|nr:FAD:protein FMN transferase [Oscillospiraceae bacterium]
LWGIGGENPRVPQADELAEAVENSGFEWLLLDENALTVRFLKPLKLDLGAIAKGYAADEMKRVLLENGVTNAILDLGGDIITIGSNKNRGWRVGLSDPFDPDPAKTCAIVTIADQTIVTSGNYERYFIHENTHYHHIFNRTTGFPAESGLVSATVIADNSATADILSTAFFVMGTEKAAKFAEKFSSEFAEIAYIFIDSDMNFTYSEGLELELELVN